MTNKKEIIIRKACVKDVNEIDRIYVEGSIDEGRLQFPEISEKEMLKNLAKFRRNRVGEWKKELKSKNNYWIVLEQGNFIIGFGNAEVKRNYDYKEGIIAMVYVDREYRKKGHGIRIVEELIRWLKKNKCKYIEAGFYWKNKPSIKMHKKLGFKPVSLKMRLK